MLNKKGLVLFFIAGLFFAWVFLDFVRKETPRFAGSKKEEQKEVGRIAVLAKNLEIPWALDFLPNGDILFTERPGRVKVRTKNGDVTTVAQLREVKHIGEGGLLGLAVDPNFSQNNFIYLYYTYESLGDNTLNKVVRFKLENNALSEDKIIIDKIPGAINHNGGRIKFGPDGMLYATTGDAQNPSLAQDKNSLAGKILRIGLGVEVYSYGHRNSQGLAWDDKGRLWSTEHGQQATDEINQVEKDKNYGWPTIRGSESASGMITPVLSSGSSTWAPAGVAILNNSVFFGGLRSQALYEIDINTLQLKEHFKGEFGRIRDVVLGPDKMLYITTSNRDGRGIPQAEDDKIIKINPNNLN